MLDRVVGIIFFVLIGLIFYTFYRSEILYDGLYRDYYLKYYIFLISSFFILLSINFLNKKIKLKIYIILISTFIGLYICETLLIDLKNLKTCVSAYNKKQEFSGGYLKIESANCQNFNKKLFYDNFSQIEIN